MWTKLVKNGTAHVLTQVFFIYKELRAQVLFCHHLMINDGQGANACQYQILRNFVRQRLEGDEEDICGS